SRLQNGRTYPVPRVRIPPPPRPKGQGSGPTARTPKPLCPERLRISSPERSTSPNAPDLPSAFSISAVVSTFQVMLTQNALTCRFLPHSVSADTTKTVSKGIRSQIHKWRGDIHDFGPSHSLEEHLGGWGPGT